MDFSPMNIRMTVPQSADVGQIQHNMNQHGAVVHDYQAVKDQQEQEHLQQQVRSKEEAEGQKIKDNPDEERGKSGYRGKKRKAAPMNSEEEMQEAEPEKMAVDQYRGQNIDISF
ncbi:hypothetical protein [Anaerovibrio lipolyticus]|uniref:hypothetical protein n=1 Tax=Anaerovibrio lipolyticus TaxID=82374 RepID=UPI0026ED694A|nr:hypothetical protein [Anaerovibrio lipolyticus]MBE6106127.1 hypothetical protein [Anaerovibrio lipolyticus]